MPRTIDYWFTLASPWAFLGHQALSLILRKQYGVTVRYRPVDVGEVFPHTGGLPLSKRHPARQRYRILRAAALARGARHPPEDPSEALSVPGRDREPHDPRRGAVRRRSGPLYATHLRGIWTKDEDLSQDAALVALMNECGHDGAAMLASAKSDAISALYAGYIQEAVAGDVIGSPCYVLDGEVFWGQDRLPLLDSALKSGRKAYRNDAAM